MDLCRPARHTRPSHDPQKPLAGFPIMLTVEVRLQNPTCPEYPYISSPRDLPLLVSGIKPHTWMVVHGCWPGLLG